MTRTRSSATRAHHERHVMNKLALAPLALLALLLGLLPPLAPATAGTATWNDGTHDQDTIWNCLTQSPSTGVSANVGWKSPTGEVPEVGEKFYLRGYIGLVGLPCSGKVAVLPEILVPEGVEFVDEDVRWDLTEAGTTQQLGTDGLEFFWGANDGIVIAQTGDEPFVLRQGDILEFQFPVRATRELKGPATQQPECLSRREGTAPCPVSQAGDHLQIAFTVAGHGGDKSYVTPYVGLFAQPAGGTDPDPDTTVDSRTAASWKLRTGRPGKAAVTVSASRTPTGRLVVKDKGVVVARATLRESHDGRRSVDLPRMRKGKHRLTVSYLGSDAVRPSTSATKRVTLR
jgi:hypothetical protein